MSNAERRALLTGESTAVPASPMYTAASPPSPASSKWSYEGELKGAEAVAREIIRAAVANVAEGYPSHLETRQVLEWFELGGSLQLSDTLSASDVLAHARQVQGLVDLAHGAGIPKNAAPPLLAAARRLRPRRALCDEEDQSQRGTRLPRRRAGRSSTCTGTEHREEPRMPTSGGKGKKYYN